PDELLPVIERMRAAAPDVTLVAKSNAGMPELVDMRAVYRADPPTMADAARDFRAAGARIIGACCGSTPDHLRAMAEALAGEATPA
ncbi:MAG TPA: homocysteine S-methyltransferase family protein, partial [Candidatus Limnocylindrales bacterium]|nr:homocysteine S-methyltransferase family protein [Candidatus Limnocylindrales bacterium]